jgi:hypothetical protein
MANIQQCEICEKSVGKIDPPPGGPASESLYECPFQARADDHSTRGFKIKGEAINGTACVSDIFHVGYAFFVGKNEEDWNP